jgi:multisubunit Na+/H+ antiporter MnhE subunit
MRSIPTRTTTPPPTTAVIASCATLLLGLWIALTDNTRPLELLVGVACAVVAAAVMVLTTHIGGVAMRLRARWLVQALPAPWWVLRDSVRVLLAALRPHPPQGRLRAVPWDPGDDRPLAVGRRAFAYTVGSLGPNQYPLVASRADGTLIVHELLPAASVITVDVVDAP